MVKVDREKCIGCNACVSVCPEGFEIKDGKATVKDATTECIEKAASGCPTGAIMLDKQESEKGENNTSESFTRGRGQGKKGRNRGRKSGGRRKRRRK